MFKIILSLAGIQVLQAAVQVFKMKFVALLLGPDGLGVISLINQFIQLIIQVSTLALPWAATRFMAVAHSHGNEDFAQKVRVFFRGIFYLSLLGMTAAGLMIWKFNHFFPAGFQTYRFLALISVSMVVPVSLKGFLLSAFTTAGKYRFSAITMFWNASTGAGAMLLGAYLSGLKGFFVAQALVEYATLAYCLTKMNGELNIRPFGGTINVWQELKTIEGSCELVILGSLLYFLSPSALMVVRYSLLKTGGEELVGVYQAVHGLVLYITLALGQATSLYLDPILKRDIPLQEKLGISNQYLRKISLVIGSLMVWVVAFPDFFLQVLYSKAFMSGADFLFAFMLIESLNLISGVYLGILVGQGWYRTHFGLGLIVHCSIGIMSWYLTPAWGIWGVILAFGSGAVATLIIIYVRLFWHYGNFVGRQEVIVPSLSISFLGTFGFWISRQSPSSGLLPEQSSLKILAVFGFLALIWFILTDEEKIACKALMKRIKNWVSGIS